MIYIIIINSKIRIKEEIRKKMLCLYVIEKENKEIRIIK